MGDMLVRDVDDETKSLIRRRAAENGRSMEAEARAILFDGVRPERRSIVLALRQAVLEHGGMDLELEPRTEQQRDVVFDW